MGAVFPEKSSLHFRELLVCAGLDGGVTRVEKVPGEGKFEILRHSSNLYGHPGTIQPSIELVDPLRTIVASK